MAYGQAVQKEGGGGIVKESKAMWIWSILYPICIYYVVMTITFVILDMVLRDPSSSRVFCQMAASMAAIPFLCSFYQTQDGRDNNKLFPLRLQNIGWMFCIGVFFAIAWNNLLGMIRIADYSAAYARAAEAFYTGRLFLELAALGIAIPIAEELLYRGIVYQRLKNGLGIPAAAALSALIFGLVHRNLVQFVYAAVFGLLLAWAKEAGGGLACSAAMHIAANGTSILRTETGLLALLDQNFTVQVIVTIASFCIAAALSYLFLKISKKL